MKIGLALSGGGVRATVFHLGVLKRIADSPRWPDITFLSTVSGGSLCIALVFEKAGQRWPTSQQFSEQCLPEARKLLTTCDLEGQYKKLLFTKPWLFLQGRASVIAKLIREHWGITSIVSQMPDPPRWQICATCYETGKNWRFSKKWMGDYLTNYVIAPEFPLAEAAAASAAVPGVIGPLRVETAKYHWHKFAKNGNEPTIEVKPIASHLTLWDGGVYENLGVEAMFKPQEGLREEVDFLITSDASKPLGIETRRFQWGIPPYLPPFRLIDVATDQVRAFRLRTIISFLEKNQNAGVVLRMGNTVAGILKSAKKDAPSSWTGRSFLSDAEVQMAAGLETTLRNLSEEEYDRLFLHGYEVAETTLFAYEHRVFDV
jgi:NTE family protein